MKQPIRVLALPLYPNQFSSRIRVGYFSTPLEERGIEVEVTPPVTETQFRKWYGGTRTDRVRYHLTEALQRLCQIARSQYYDILWVQKGLALYPWRHLGMWKSLFANRVVVDIDDDVIGHPAVEVRGWKRWIADPNSVSKLVATADWVTSGNEALTEKIRRLHPRVSTLPSTIPLQAYDLSAKAVSKPERPTLVWVGTESNRRYLNRVAAVVSQLAVRFDGLQLLVVSDGLTEIETDRFHPCEVKLEEWAPETEVESIRKGWVGIMPLDESEWAQMKGGYKVLQYMACGLPAVATPTRANTDIVETGVSGFLPKDDDEWTDALARLLTDEHLRNRMGESGRYRVENRYSTEKWADFLAGLFEKLGGRNRL